MITSHTFVALSYSEFQEKFNHALNVISFKPTLAFVFASVSFPLTSLMDVFKSQQIRLFGSTTGGEILFDKTLNHIGEKSVVVVLTDIHPDCFRLFPVKRGNATPYALGAQLGEKITAAFRHPSALVVGSGIVMDGQALVEGIVSKTGNEMPLYGGLAGDDGRFEKTFVFTEETVTDDGVIALVLNQSKIELTGMISGGWISLGAEFTVDKADGNTVYQINGLPALDMYMNYLNVKEEDLPAMGIEYPFMVRNEDGTSVLRAITGIDKDRRSLIFAGSVPAGSVISFSTSPGFEIMENTREKIIAFHEKNKKADLLILFSCIARHLALGPLISTEIKLASIKWKKPLAGFFTYGEIGNNEKGHSTFHNQTFTLALLRKKRS
ncbi:FIST C-terminal domain-containing protein [Candidatus Sulfidibacterium hydrothermale]|uniref:FIST signal transduction protein n=1 Tax=Candidatus Sulfidibacterium hydrothermale TaxID=2875962 RepID=UPI001F0A2602|nr:FIST N-terminal domain-containing protein [Candidatus Sulfidibacterium hydrothermale]UBM62964.1 FIST C-terminal domain-containing protein [Candidatus Sulfidibacterium hydrothermale]